MHDGWMYQGRQYHMWFGHGTKPVDGSSAADGKPDLGSIDERIHNLGHTLVAGLPASKRYHATARLGADDHARLDRVMEGVVRALPLGPRVTALRVLGMHPDGPGVGPFVEAGRVLASAQTHADLREATDKVAASAQEMGLDNFKPFLRRADDHLTGTGGLLALLRDLPKSASPVTSLPVIRPPVRPALPPPGQLAPLLRGVLRKAGLAGLALTALEALIEAHREAEIRAAIERFKLDPTKASDVAAALAYVWASHNRALLIVTPPGDGQLGTSLPESAQGTVAEQVMRAVQKDPTLLNRAMAGDAGALGAIRSIVQTVASGLAVIVRNEEERQLRDDMIAEGKTGEEIQAKLDELRRRAGAPSRIDLPKNPDDLLKDGWIETTHPNAAVSGRRTFEDPRTGEKLSFDKGRAGEPGFRGSDHYHRANPDGTSKRDEYLDVHGNPTPDGSKRSHILPGGR